MPPQVKPRPYPQEKKVRFQLDAIDARLRKTMETVNRRKNRIENRLSSKNLKKAVNFTFPKEVKPIAIRYMISAEDAKAAFKTMKPIVKDQRKTTKMIPQEATTTIEDPRMKSKFYTDIRVQKPYKLPTLPWAKEIVASKPKPKGPVIKRSLSDYKNGNYGAGAMPSAEPVVFVQETVKNEEEEPMPFQTAHAACSFPDDWEILFPDPPQRISAEEEKENEPPSRIDELIKRIKASVDEDPFAPAAVLKNC